MLPGEPGTLDSLHQAAGHVAVLVSWAIYAHIAVRFLHDDAQNDARIAAELGGTFNAVPNHTDIWAVIAIVEHGRLVGIEQVFKT